MIRRVLETQLRKCIEIRESAICTEANSPIYDMLDLGFKGISEGPLDLMGERARKKLAWDKA